MLRQQSGKIRTLFSKLPEGIKINQGAAYLSTSRVMGSEIGSGSGKGGGAGGRLVDTHNNKPKWSFTLIRQSIFERLNLKSRPPLSSSPKDLSSNSSSAPNPSSTSKSVREAGGSMGKKGAAQEEQYFANQSKQMKDKLKQHLKDEIKKHEEAIKASKELMKEIEK